MAGLLDYLENFLKRRKFTVAAFLLALLLTISELLGIIDVLNHSIAVLGWLKNWLFELETLPLASRFMIVCLVALVAVLLSAAARRIERKYVSYALQYAVILGALSVIAIFVTLRPKWDGVPVKARILVATLECGGSQRDNIYLLKKTLEKAQLAIDKVHKSTSSTTEREILREPMKVLPVLRLSSPANARKEILENVRRENASYLVLAVSDDMIDYSTLLRDLQGEVITFVVRPASLLGPDHKNTITIFPSPEREGEWMAQHLLRQRSKRIAILTPAHQQEFEARCRIRFSQVLLQNYVQPYRLEEYSNEREVEERLKDILSDPEQPDAIYVIDQSPTQSIVPPLANKLRFSGHLALTSYASDFYDLRHSKGADINITLPWPLEHYFAMLLADTLRKPEEKPENETITTAAAFSALVLADFAHNGVAVRGRREIIACLSNLHQHSGQAHIPLPLGSTSIRDTPNPPKSDFQFKVLKGQDL